MAHSDLVLRMLSAYNEGDMAGFIASAQQIADQEAAAGHTKRAADLQSLVDRAREYDMGVRLPGDGVGPTELGLQPVTSQVGLDQMVLAAETRRQLEQIAGASNEREPLAALGLEPMRRLIFEGPRGTGKTMAAMALAYELRQPLYRIALNRVQANEATAIIAEIETVFDRVSQERGIVLIDSMEALATKIAGANYIEESSRVIYALMHLVKEDRSGNIIITATSIASGSTRTLLSFYDQVIRFRLPDEAQVEALLRLKLRPLNPDFEPAPALIERARGLSHASIARLCDDAIRSAILDGREIDNALLLRLMD